jgi:hypothetical protein
MTRQAETEKTIRRVLAIKRRMMAGLSRELARSERLLSSFEHRRVELIELRFERVPKGDVENITQTLSELHAVTEQIAEEGMKHSRELEIQERIKGAIEAVYAEIRALEAYRSPL